MLVIVALGLMLVFGIAIWLKPYDADGEPLELGTHLQLGLPPCTFRVLSGLPCPSCGLTTSFAFFVRGDLKNSARANAVGTLLAVFCLALVPWCLASAWRGRYYLVRSVEWPLLGAVLLFTVLLLARWAVVVGRMEWHRYFS